MTTIQVPALYGHGETTASFIACEISKIAPNSKQVIVFQCSPDVDADRALELINHIKAIDPDDVFVACIDHRFSLMACNIPAVVAILEKLEIAH